MLGPGREYSVTGVEACRLVLEMCGVCHLTHHLAVCPLHRMLLRPPNLQHNLQVAAWRSSKRWRRTHRML